MQAKDLVEKAPVEIMKDVKEADANVIMKKLMENGAKITLK